MNNTLLLATPRSGSNFLTTTLCDSSNLLMGSEFFSGGDNCNLYCYHHMKFINWYYRHGFKKDYAFKIYQKMFQVISSDNYDVVQNRDALNPDHADLLLELLKHNPKKSWSRTLKRYITRDRLCIKIFHNHYDYENHFDIKQVIEMFDNLIVLYREDMLKQFTSWCVAKKTANWFCSVNSKNRISSQIKATWNLDDYMSFQQEQIEWTRENKQCLSEFSHKKTALIKYEDINNSNYRHEIEKILESNGIEHNVGYSNAKKQSIESIDIADRFINKEEFLDDQPKIKDKLLLKIEDL